MSNIFQFEATEVYYVQPFTFDTADPCVNCADVNEKVEKVEPPLLRFPVSADSPSVFLE